MNRTVSWFCKIFLAPIVSALFIKKVSGRENVPKGNFILAANHQSHLDEIAASYVCVPRRFHFIGQTDNYTGFTKFLLHIIYFIGGVIPLNRKKKDSKKWVIKEATRVLKEGDILIIYPEGTRTRTGEIGEGKWGVARMFLETRVPVLPVGIKGTFDLLPPGGKLKIKRIVEISIGKPLFFKEEIERARINGKQIDDNEKLLSEITNKIMEKISSLKTEMDK